MGTTLDSIDIDERLIEAAEHLREIRRVSEHNADSLNDESPREEKARTVAAYQEKFLATSALWALRGAK